MTSKYEFVPCGSCASKPGTPAMCPSCISNRQAINALSNQMTILASAMKKFAPDLMEELILRHKAANLALDEFVEYMRRDK